MFDLADEESLIGTADAEVVIKTKEYAGLIPEHDEYRAVILPDGSLVVEIKYIEINYSFTMVLNGGNFTYETKAAMVDDFLNDYNTYFKTTYTRENLPLGAWVLNNFHTFLYDENITTSGAGWDTLPSSAPTPTEGPAPISRPSQWPPRSTPLIPTISMPS